MAKTVQQNIAEIIGGITVQLAEAITERDLLKEQNAALVKEIADVRTESVNKKTR